MKKLIAVILMVMVAMTFSVTAFATEEEVVETPEVNEETLEETPEEVPTETPTETPDEVVDEVVDETPKEDEVVPTPNTEAFNKDEFANQFVAYIFSGTENADEIMDKIIAMGEQYKQYKEDGYTFEERLEQMVTTENIVALASAGFLVVCGIAFFVIEDKRKKDRKATAHYVAVLQEKYAEEVESNKAVKEALANQTEVVAEMRKILEALIADADSNKLNLDSATRSSKAVAKMVKDVFLCSKTIDASGKELLTRNYLEAMEDSDVPEE